MCSASLSHMRTAYAGAVNISYDFQKLSLILDVCTITYPPPIGDEKGVYTYIHTHPLHGGRGTPMQPTGTKCNCNVDQRAVGEGTWRRTAKQPAQRRCNILRDPGRERSATLTLNSVLF